VGFEFAIAAGGHAEGSMLGRAGFPTGRQVSTNPCPRSPCTYKLPTWEPEPRGVLGNVAYGNYELQNQNAARTIDKLDDALFSSYAQDDPRAFPVLRKP
jgi:hypothetical protein